VRRNVKRQKKKKTDDKKDPHKCDVKEKHLDHPALRNDEVIVIKP
jgi:hypothetical protein